jgi:dimethylhistidine N-methyltransferase
MASSYKVLSADEIEEEISSIEEFARDTFLGFNKTPKQISSKYLYDTIGSKIYEKIMELPEYYLVNAEFEILHKYKATFANFVGDMKINLVELGAGNGYKTNIILEEFLKKIAFEYVPIDISESAMKSLILSLNKKFPKLQTNGIVADYFDSMKYLKKQSSKCNFVMFLGSNIGNFLYPQAMEFLYRLWNVLHDGDYLLIGFDLRKELNTMVNAYNDSQGVTADFNYNVLHRMNRELGANFNVSKFKHYEPYDVFTGAMTSYLLSMEDQEVFIKKLKRSFSFKKWEPIHIEQSYKYTEQDIDDLASTSGFKVIDKFYDSNHYFCNALWQCQKPK